MTAIDEKPKLNWLTSSKAKSLAMLIPSIASAIAIIIASFKPTGFEASAKAYDLLKQEITEQRAEIMQVNKSLAELQAWVTIWRNHENKLIEETQGKIVETCTLPKVAISANKPQTSKLPPRAEKEVLVDEQIPPPPPPPPAPRSRAALPDKKMIGL